MKTPSGKVYLSINPIKNVRKTNAKAIVNIPANQVIPELPDLLRIILDQFLFDKDLSNGLHDHFG